MSFCELDETRLKGSQNMRAQTELERDLYRERVWD